MVYCAGKFLKYIPVCICLQCPCSVQAANHPSEAKLQSWVSATFIKVLRASDHRTLTAHRIHRWSSGEAVSISSEPANFWNCSQLQLPAKALPEPRKRFQTRHRIRKASCAKPASLLHYCTNVSWKLLNLLPLQISAFNSQDCVHHWHSTAASKSPTKLIAQQATTKYLGECLAGLGNDGSLPTAALVL